PDLSLEYLVDAEQAKLIQRQFDAAGLHSMKNLLRVFKVLPPRIMSMAMTGAHPKMMVKVKKKLPRREASRLQYEIDHGGPIRLEDIILAQQAVLSALTHYEQHGSAFPAA
ncbi:MAG: FliG C-terminal domain-containing protein, partial [Planctomycetota bacterium]|nr:FliG C-terminal domain-containing protein [Planctomycetota bacterium]